MSNKQPLEKAHDKLYLLKHGVSVWFSPQEIEAVEKKRKRIIRETWESCVVFAVCLITAWILGAPMSFFYSVNAIAPPLLVFAIMFIRKYNKELDVMRDHQTRAHRSFFEENQSS